MDVCVKPIVANSDKQPVPALSDRRQTLVCGEGLPNPSFRGSMFWIESTGALARRTAGVLITRAGPGPSTGYWTVATCVIHALQVVAKGTWRRTRRGEAVRRGTWRADTMAPLPVADAHFEGRFESRRPLIVDCIRLGALPGRTETYQTNPRS